MGRSQVDAQANPYGNISNANTDIPSSQYPHTKAIQIQEAKYKFVVDGSTNQAKQWAGKVTDWAKQRASQGAAPARQQPEATTPAPAQQQPTEQQPEAATPAPTEQQRPEATPTPAPAEQQQPEAATPAPAEQQQKQAPTAGISDAAAKVIELTNAERRKNGLPDYQADAQLSGVAKVKSDDMQQNNYFSHTSPTHGSPFDMIRDHGVSYNSAGENIAKGQQTPEQVVQSWMNSEGHRKNILSADFTHIGVGYNEQGHYWTQMFIRK
ncbi:hypothetical protein H1D32_02680 [Anaerobacillus sp. CMMVII]|nr:hypothetical protein [Anaerobacillus sp. CMMVII]